MRKVRKQAKLDGREWQWKKPLFMSWPLFEPKESYPLITQKECSQFELSLMERANENVNRLSRAWQKEDEKLKPAYCHAKANKDALIKKHDKELVQHKGAIDNFKVANKNFMDYPPSFMPAVVFWFIFSIITVGEGFFNYFVFQQFGESEWQTYSMAAAIVILIPLASELCGHFVKKSTKTSTDWFWVITSVCVVALLLIMLGVLRESFFETTQAQTQDKYQIPLSPTTLALILIVFNLAIFTVLTFLAYAQSRPDPDAFNTVKKQYKNAYDNLKKQGGDVYDILPQLAKAEEEYNKIRALRSVTHKKYCEMAEEEKRGWIALIHEYRHTNMRFRKSKQEPDCFKIEMAKLESLKIPESLTMLDWTCDEDRV
jgi:uncharacterized membrane protein YidH (DUF202 family)